MNPATLVSIEWDVDGRDMLGRAFEQVRERLIPTPDAELRELWQVLKAKRGSRRG